MINYGILDESVMFYEYKGFTRIESPWTVTKAVSDITRPPEAKEFVLKHENNKVLVASGEQSFLYLYLKGFLPKGQFQTITPCFRHETFDSLHTKYFIKNELIKTDSTEITDLERVVEVAADFFKQWLGDVTIEELPTGFDISFQGVELGSYGIRSCDFLTWIYGTGIAEPRFSNLLAKLDINPRNPKRPI